MPIIREEFQRAYINIEEKVLYNDDFKGNDTIFTGMVADTVKESNIEKEDS